VKVARRSIITEAAVMEPSWDEVSGTPSMARGAVRRGLTLGKIHKDKHVIKVALVWGYAN
jgi:hypothetical protein